ncbi:MAG: autotransporter domain-containing protein, partial [Acidiferrobacter sp.]
SSTTWTLTGTTTAVTPWQIDGGTLEVGDAAHPNASIAGPVTVNSGGTLRGHGTINGTVTNKGTVFPGGTIGILTINGNYTQAATGTLNIEVTPNDITPGVGYDQLNVTGSAALAGHLAVQVDSGTYTVGESYDIVHAAGGVTGTFAQTTYNPAFAAYITPQVSYGAHDVSLVLKANPLAFASASGVTESPYIVNQSLFGALSTVLDGAQSTGGATPHFTDLHQGAWMKGAGDFGQSQGASVTDFGGITGYGKTLSRHLVVGGAFSGLGTTTTTSQQTLNGQSFGVYGYGIYTRGALRVSASVGAGALSQDSQRNLAPTGLIATGSTSGWFTDTGVQAQYLIPMGQAFLMPYGSATYLHTSLNGFSEHGAGSLNLTYGSQTGNLGALTAGVRTGMDLTDHTLTIVPWVELGGAGTAGNRTLTTTETIGVTNVNATSQMAPAASLDVGVGVTVTSHGPWAARLAYAGQFAGSTHLNSFDLLGRYRF